MVLPDAVRLVRSWWIIVQEEQKSLSRVRITADFITQEVARETQPSPLNRA